MADQKMPFGKAVALHVRAVKDISKVCPKLFWITNLHATLHAVLPYATIFFSAQILNELSGARRPDVLWRWVLVAVLGGGALTGLTSFLLRKREVQVEIYWKRQKRILTNKLFLMDFPDIEKKSTHEMYSQILASEQAQMRGLAGIQTIYARLLNNATGILSAVVLTIGLFIKPVSENAGRLTLLNHPLFVIAMVVVVLGFCYLSGWLYKKAEEKYIGMMSITKFSNLIERHIGNYGQERGQTSDVRIYKQHGIIGHYLEKHTVWESGSDADRFIKREIAPMESAEQLVSAVFAGLIYVYTCLKALGGAFGIGSVTQYVGAITAFSGNFSEFIGYIGILRTNAEYLEQTYTFLDIPNSMYQGSLTTEKRADRKYEIEFRNVSFQYPGSEVWALRHVNVRFKVGTRLAVVGENGSGKTTFIKLLCRLYDPQEGEILLNGIDIRKYNYRDYMDVFSVVFQDYQLLSQPLGANVAGNRVYDEARVIKALNDAGFNERLKKLPDGLDTQLYNAYSESGVEISGGEAQKIAIARALYKNAPILILDEPTAALDPIAEAEIYAQLNQIVDDRTAIYISHRLSSCRFCDEIIVFDHGQIIQRDTHDLLVEKAGKYRELWNAQAQYYE